MKMHEKIIIFSLLVVLPVAGFSFGFWLGGGFNNNPDVDIERREQVIQEGLGSIESNNIQFEEKLNGERKDRDEFERIIIKEGYLNSGLKSDVKELQGLSIRIKNRAEEIDRGFEDVIKQILEFKNNINNTDNSPCD